MESEARCPRCSAPLPPGIPPDRCPACALALALAPQSGDPETGSDQTTHVGRDSTTRVPQDVPTNTPRDVPTKSKAGSTPRTPDLPPSRKQAGERLGAGRFTMTHLLGRGGMGEVWLAQDELLRQPVALKLLPVELRHDASAMEALRRETARCQRLAHPNIIRVHDLHEDAEEAFLTMEYVDGPTLTNLRIDQPNRVLPWNMLAPLVAQLCEALAYAHGENIIHRDLKPSNLMVDSRGRLKLADFGIAATISATLNHVSANLPRSGTPSFMSPQQCEGLLPRVTDDIYALGASLYDLLTGRPPFHSGDVLHQLLHVQPKRLSERLSEFGITNEIQSAVEETILRCLAKDARQRPQSATEVASSMLLSILTPARDFAVPMSRESPFVRLANGFGSACRAVARRTQAAVASVLGWRQLRRRWLAASVAAALAVLTGLLLLGTSPGEGLARLSFDISSTRHPPPLPKEVVTVLLDDESHKVLEQPVNAPWNRALHARLIDRLRDEGARLIVFDIILSEASANSNADDAFEKAMRASGRVVLAGEHVEQKDLRHVGTGSTTPPHEAFRNAGLAWGLSNLPDDSDFGIRRFPSSIQDNPTLAEAVIASWRGQSNAPTAPARNRWLQYYGPASTIPGVSYHDALLTNGAPKNFFRDKAVFVGALQASGFFGAGKDTFRTPFTTIEGSFASGVEIHATTFLNLLHGHALRDSNFAINAFLLFAVGSLVGVVLVMVRPWAAVLLAAACCGVVFLSGDVAVSRWKMWFPWLIIFVQVAVALGVSVVYNSVRSVFELRVLQRSLAMHLPPQRVKQILQHPESLRPGAEKLEVSLLFSDIAGFSTIADRTLSEKLFQRLNAYFKDLLGCIHEAQGTVLQLTGDGVFAIWNAPERQPKHQELACRAALRMRDTLGEQLKSRIGFAFQTRVGLHFGTASVGNYGSESRVSYSAVGTNVNIASRLEALNKHLGTSILASDAILAEVEDVFVTRSLGFFRLKGLGRTIEVFELLGLRKGSTEQAWLQTFVTALDRFQKRDFDDAEYGFNQVVKARKEDGPSSFYLELIWQFRANPPRPDWMGEVVMGEK